MDDNKQPGWIGVDLDATLCRYDGWIGPEHIGKPIPKMVDKVKEVIAAGYKVKIFTARCAAKERLAPVTAWLEENGLGGLEITNVKDQYCIEIWDDRCVQVIPNTGQFVGTSRILKEGGTTDE